MNIAGHSITYLANGRGSFQECRDDRGVSADTMNHTLTDPIMYGYLLLLYGLTLAMAWYLDWWKKNHK